MNNTMRFIGVTKDATTAGPGKRLELFTKGCIRGVINPCKGCFNESTWTFEGQSLDKTVDEVVEMIDRDAWNRQVTFCGGEPILQAKAITKVAKRLKEMDPTFHFVMYTAYKLDTLMKHGLEFTWVREKHGEGMRESLLQYGAIPYTEPYVNARDPHIKKIKFELLNESHILELMKYIDIIVDGDYQEDKRLTTHETMHEGWYVGSSNQRIIYCRHTLERGSLIYDYADKWMVDNKMFNTCKCCGHPTMREDQTFCNMICELRYEKRQEQMKIFGVA